MRLFINDTPVNVVPPEKVEEGVIFQTIINAKKEKILPVQLSNNVLVKKVGPEHLAGIFKLIGENPFNYLDSLTLVASDYPEAKAFIKQHFKIIKAAGGIVKRGNKILMIYRLQKWDLPKGKVEKDEKSKAAAVREVEEECNITVKLEHKVCTTWHTYTLRGDNILKKTNWYAMSAKNISKLAPQKKEGIEQAKFMNHKELFHALKDSYRSINFVFDRYHKSTILED